MSRFNGELPDGWRWSTLGAEFKWGSGGTPKSTVPAYYDGGIPWAVIGDLNDGVVRATARTISDEGLRNSSAKWIDEGAILIAMYGSIGKLGIAGNALTTNQAIAFTKPETVNPRYLFWYLRSIRSELTSLGKGGTQSNISQTVIKSIPFPVAPCEVQDRIVEEIETQLARLDDAVASLQRARARLKRYRASVLKAACEGRLVPTEAELAQQEGRDYEPASVLLDRIKADRESSANGKRRKSKKAAPLDRSRMPELPGGWAWAKIAEIADVGTGATPLRSNKAFYDGGSVPWVTSGALNDDRVTEAREYVTSKALDETNLTLFPSGTLLIAMYGEGKTRGKCSELAIEAATNQAIAAVVFDEASRPLKAMVKLFLASSYEDMRRAASGGVQPNLNLSIIKNIGVPIPPLCEQERIVEEAERRLTILDQVESAVGRNLKRAETLRQSVLRSAFSGRRLQVEQVAENLA